ncbi:unnamed protein product [Mytilus coruscus]|uniref:B box-type domain-containing protein n=1 Tax=Mytilus coruscus TaxID=42192 RepID=A0A6J8ET88_MYTCO|nr:unnamed protein product [Mytilus coruscus]
MIEKQYRSLKSFAIHANRKTFHRRPSRSALYAKKHIANRTKLIISCIKYPDIIHKIIPLQKIEEHSASSKELGFVNCEEHPDKNIEIFCNDHSTPCCTVCATVHHRKCEQIVSVDKAASGVKQSTKAWERMVKLKETSAKLGKVILYNRNCMTTFEQDIEVVLTDLKSQKDNVIKRINKLELKLQNETHDTKKRLILKMSDKATATSSLKSTIDDWKHILEACSLHSSDLQVLVKMEENLSGLDTNTVDTITVDINTVDTITVDTNTEDTIKVDTNTVGTITVNTNTEGTIRVDTNTEETITVDTNTEDTINVDTNTADTITVDTNTEDTIKVDTNTVDTITVDTNTVGTITVETTTVKIITGGNI